MPLFDIEFLKKVHVRLEADTLGAAAQTAKHIVAQNKDTKLLRIDPVPVTEIAPQGTPQVSQ